MPRHKKKRRQRLRMEKRYGVPSSNPAAPKIVERLTIAWLDDWQRRTFPDVERQAPAATMLLKEFVDPSREVDELTFAFDLEEAFNIDVDDDIVDRWTDFSPSLQEVIEEVNKLPSSNL